MILTKINIDELKLAETDITRSVYAMLPPELKDIVKDNAPKLYQPPIKTQVSVDAACQKSRKTRFFVESTE
jgi:hypothetical protein